MKNYFEIFNLPATFNINKPELESKHLMLQNQIHPDSSDLEDLESSITLNEAYKTLSDDFLRSCYILKLNDIDILKDEKAVNVDQSTLIEILELQETISESDNEELEEIKSNLKSDILSLINCASDLISESSWNKAAQTLIKVKYLKKSLIDLKERQRQLW